MNPTKRSPVLSLVSATGKTQIKMTLEEQEIKVNDIAYIQIDLVGENEIIKANSDKLLSISVEGGKFIALGSANPCTEERFDSGNYTTYYGQALAVVYADKSGEIIISASAEGLDTIVAKIYVIE